ncbi:PTS sugar transporter subunit IIA [Streptococcus cuniculipharyngis]|uniref:PTS sugar transporter subunit IIA n=1 Tax=Streptococcus cuniculipharyngis TaxID=1562651 RepID=A0A5C5SFP8_9STRE|nr:PTS sugar transporter subunit IIA [Streptococcus cuniculipharyngis]TWS99122.1 PTS sugar transporter subunit IIA [Streptococcus cuniculipharyngis]
MAKQLVLISHGSFCEGLKASTEMLMGPQDNIHTVVLEPSEGADDFRQKLEDTIKDFEEFVVFCDLQGGTPCNVASRLLLEGRQFDLYAGMSMPMVIGFINNELVNLDEDLVEFAKVNTMKINDMLFSSDDDDDD